MSKRNKIIEVLDIMGLSLPDIDSTKLIKDNKGPTAFQKWFSSKSISNNPILRKTF